MRAGPLSHIGGNSASNRHTFATLTDDHVNMLDIDMVRMPPFALVRAAGTIESANEVETFLSALEFVPDNEDLVIDLSGLELLTVGCASAIHACVSQRVAWSEAVVVSTEVEVTMQLVLCEIDRVVPIVRGLQEAADVISARRGTLAVT